MQPCVPALSNVPESLNYIDVVITSVFIIECIMKVVAMGFILPKHAYLKDNWNVLDFFLVVLALECPNVATRPGRS